jgi:hypothetical protein
VTPLGFKVTLPNKASLVAVTDDRFGDTFDVPKRHLGQKLPNMKVHQLADLALKYLESLVAEGAKLSE